MVVGLSISRHLSVFRHGGFDTIVPSKPGFGAAISQLLCGFRDFRDVVSASRAVARESL